MNREFKEIAESITLHGLGFIQVKLENDQRLHIWHPELPRRKCFKDSSIHSHRFSFTSRVIIGTQVHRAWTVSARGAPTHIGYSHGGERISCGGRPWDFAGEYFLKPNFENKIKAGGEYYFHADEYHDTPNEGIVVTVMTKLAAYKNPAISFCKIGVKPDDKFNRYQLSECELWDYVTDAFKSGVRSWL